MEGRSMHEHGSLPRARQDGLIEETVGEELLLYDRDSHAAHCLSPVAACVWRHCDGERDLAELAVLAGVSESFVADALHELREKHLVDAEPDLMQSTIPGESRRQAIGRIVRIGAATAPFVVSATAATPAMAESTKGCANCRTEMGCCVTADAVCCCCNNGETVTQSKGFSCLAPCSGVRGGVFKETLNAMGS